jgi:hypothetical protein
MLSLLRPYFIVSEIYLYGDEQTFKSFMYT